MRPSKFAIMLAFAVRGIVSAQSSDAGLTASETPDPFKQLEQVQKARTREQALQTAAKEQYFVESFNRLAAALETFSKTYKVTHVVDANQVKCIREAYRNLERADPWFRTR